jgi:hypothetical protein
MFGPGKASLGRGWLILININNNHNKHAYAGQTE